MCTTTSFHKPLILIVEDDEDDRHLIQEAFDESGYSYDLCFAIDGTDALEQLEGMKTLPTLVLLDVNMPRMNGFEFLRHVRGSVELCCLPVVMFSTSGEAKTVKEAYERGANSYIQKPKNYFQLGEVVAGLRRYWIDLARVPDHDRMLGMAQVG